MNQPKSLAPARQATGKRQKPSFAEFMAAWKRLLAMPEQQALVKARAALQAGVAEQVTSAQVSQITASLGSHLIAEPLAVGLAVRDLNGGLKGLPKQVLPVLRARFAEDCAFDPSDLARPDSTERLDRWLHASLRKAREEASASGTWSASVVSKWVRKCFVCICAEPRADARFAAALALLDVWISTTGKKRNQRPDTQFYHALNSVLAAMVPSVSRCETLLAANRLSRDALRAAVRREESTYESLELAKREIIDLSQTADTLRDQLTTACETIATLSAELEVANTDLRSAQETYSALDEHWSRSSASTLAKTISGYGHEIGHEVTEALLSLDRAEPNVTMALDRLRRIEMILRRMVSQPV